MNTLPPVFQRQVALDPNHLNVAMRQRSDDGTTLEQQILAEPSLYHFYNIESGSITEICPRGCPSRPSRQKAERTPIFRPL